jgi:hypothetical protein
MHPAETQDTTFTQAGWWRPVCMFPVAAIAEVAAARTATKAIAIRPRGSDESIDPFIVISEGERELQGSLPHCARRIPDA